MPVMPSFSTASATQSTVQQASARTEWHALGINGILYPLQFPPPGIKRDFRGIHRHRCPDT